MKRIMIMAAAVCLAASASLSVYADQIIGFSPRQPETEAPVQAEVQQAEDKNQDAAEDPEAAVAQPEEGDQAEEDETTADDGFEAPDTYPAYLAPQYAKETPEGISYLESEDGTHVMIVGFRGDVADGGKAIIPEEIDSLPVTEIAESAFAGNSVIKYLLIPESVSVIGEYAVSRVYNLETAVLPKSMKEIPVGMFEGCGSLKNIELPPELVSIGDMAFSGCTVLGRLYIPATVSNIGFDAFSACEKLLLDCTDNSSAANYAEANGIETVGSETWNSMLIKMAVITAVLGAAVLAVPKIYRKIRTRK